MVALFIYFNYGHYGQLIEKNGLISQLLRVQSVPCPPDSGPSISQVQAKELGEIQSAQTIGLPVKGLTPGAPDVFLGVQVPEPSQVTVPPLVSLALSAAS